MKQIKKYSAVSWNCPGCNQLQAMLDTINTSDKIMHVDIDSLSRTELQSTKIRSVPVLIAYSEDGSEAGRINGVPTKEALEKFIAAYI